MTKILINNLGRVEQKIISLADKEEKVLAKGNLNFIKRVVRSAKLMAPRDTGELASSIRIKSTKTKGKTKQYLIEAEAWHAAAQEYGFTPHYAYIRNSSKLAPGVYFVSKSKPFMRPAIEKNLSAYFQEINNGIGGVLAK